LVIELSAGGEGICTDIRGGALDRAAAVKAFEPESGARRRRD